MESLMALISQPLESESEKRERERREEERKAAQRAEMQAAEDAFRRQQEQRRQADAKILDPFECVVRELPRRRNCPGRLLLLGPSSLDRPVGIVAKSGSGRCSTVAGSTSNMAAGRSHPGPRGHPDGQVQ